MIYFPKAQNILEIQYSNWLKEKEKLNKQLVEIQEKLKKFDNVSSAV